MSAEKKSHEGAKDGAPLTTPVGDVGSASTPLSPNPDDIVLYDEAEWASTEESIRQKILSTITVEFQNVLSEIENMGDGAAEQSIMLERRRNFFKLSLIIATGVIALVNFLGSATPKWTHIFGLVAGTIAISVSILGAIDSYFSFSERCISMAELHYRSRDAAVNLRARWAIAVTNKPDFKTYRNAFRALDAAQRELQQINTLAKRIMRDRQAKTEGTAT